MAQVSKRRTQAAEFLARVLDQQELVKGLAIPEGLMIEAWKELGKKGEFSLFRLQVRGELQRRLAAEDRAHLVVCQVHGSLQILTDLEAVQWQRRVRDGLVAGFGRLKEVADGIDTSGFVPEEEREHAEEREKTTRYYEAITRTTRQLGGEPIRAQLPPPQVDAGGS